YTTLFRSRMKQEWFDAMKGGPAGLSNFDYAAMLTETILLGNIAIRLVGQELAWDGPAMKFQNNPAANQFLHTEYRKGWSLYSPKISPRINADQCGSKKVESSDPR